MHSQGKDESQKNTQAIVTKPKEETLNTWLKTSVQFAIGAFTILFISLVTEAQDRVSSPDKPNVLFIVVDDLRPELGCYEKSYIKSPNIDRLSKSGVTFNNSYANFPVCGPSRASMLSGLYPNNNRFVKWNCSQDQEVPGVVSLPMHFKNNNYQTISLGKVYNNFEDGKGSWDKVWRAPVFNSPWEYQSKRGIDVFEELNKERYKDLAVRNNNNLPKPGLPFENPDVPDDAYPDGKIANRAIAELQNFQSSSESFFLAVGFHKPHLPFNAPEKYWDIYSEQEISLAANDFFPKDAPSEAMFNWGELRAYYGIPQKGPLPDTLAYNLIHGYYACVSYVDAQIGRVINALEDLGLAENTIVVLVGDHGWFLGEHGFWSKHANFERAAHVPLIVKMPWKEQGVKTDALVELVDVYPTLCELAGLDLPFHLQGKSFATLLDDPELPWKEEIFFRRSGETILTKTHTYTEWVNYESGKPYARMLYDLQKDPEENINISELSENKKLIEVLHDKLHDHIKNRDEINIH